MPICGSYRGTWLGALNTHRRSLAGIGLAFLIAVSLFPACSGKPIRAIKAFNAKGVYHRVKSGETLYMIARAYNVELQELAEVNNIEDPNRIEADSVIFVPDARQVIDDVMASMRQSAQAPARPAVPAAVIQPRAETMSGLSTIRIKSGKVEDRLPDALKQETKDAAGPDKETPARPVHQAAEAAEQPVATQEAAATSPPIQFDRKRFIWPVKGRVVSRFGIQPNGMYYNGITIAATEGMPVVAAAQGTVIFSGSLKDYGDTIIIKHEDQYATVYTHLGQRQVKIEDRVKQAAVIGHLGKNEGKGSEARLSFEIRYQNKARNPAFFLP
jgi:lipoprotein NlpD